MFNKIVNVNGMTDDIANRYFVDSIVSYNTPSFRGSIDYSMLTTCRTLLHSKMQENDFLILKTSQYQGVRMRKDSVENTFRQEMDVYSSYSSNYNDKKCSMLSFFIVNNDGDTFKAFSEFLAETEDFREVEKIRLFFAKNFQCCLYVNDITRVSMFVMEGHRSADTTLRYYHSAQCAILNALPWYFDPEKGKESLTEGDLSLIQSIANGDYDTYIDIVEKYVEECDFRKEAINKFLEKFETELDRNREQNYQRELNDVKRRIEDLMVNLSDLTRRQRDAMCMLEGIRAGIVQKEGRHDLRDMFNTYDSLRYIKNDGDRTIIFAVDKYIDNWNSTALDNALHNRDSILYRYVRNTEPEKVEKLFKAIFEDRVIKAKVTGLYYIDSDGRLDGYEGNSQYIKRDYMPNPHIYYFRCISGFVGDIADALRQQNFAFAIEIAMESAGNINFEDSAVMENWTRWIFEQNCDGKRCFELPDGSSVNLEGALNWIDSQKGDIDEQIN